MSPLYIREFLNLPQNYAGAHVIVELDEDGEGTIILADCKRSTQFEINGLSYPENTLHKLEVLHKALGRALRHVKKAIGERDG